MSQDDKVQGRRKLKPGMGKGKGAGFEGKVAKLLSEGLAPLNFMRTPGSGARVGGKNFAKLGALFGEDALKIFVGDVTPINEKQVGLGFRWSIECKFYRTPDTFPHLVAGSANVFKWFEEARVDAAKVDRLPMLVFKWNNTKIFVAVDGHAKMGVPRPRIRLTSYHTDDAPSLDVYELDDLLTDDVRASGFWTAKLGD
jgi:hypothetical protein